MGESGAVELAHRFLTHHDDAAAKIHQFGQFEEMTSARPRHELRPRVADFRLAPTSIPEGFINDEDDAISRKPLPRLFADCLH